MLDHNTIEETDLRMDRVAHTQEIAPIYVQVTDPGGQERRFSLDIFPFVLGTRMRDTKAFRDSKLPTDALLVTYVRGRYWLKVMNADLQLGLGSIALQLLELPLHVSLSFGDSKIIFSTTPYQATGIDYPPHVQAWRTESKKGLALIQTVRRASQTRLSIYLYGETGTGKEVLAKLIHHWSERVGRPFVPINCGALPLSLVESELFGHTKGAFTGASRDRPGAFLQAHGGTLFLDEVGDLPLEVQVKLLRFLESGEIRPVGADRTITVDVRVVCATHKPLQALVREGKFRQDLYFRLASIPIEIPSLQNRPEDVVMLARHFTEEFDKTLSARALLRLQSYSWPGNVRELRHAIERASGSVNLGEMVLEEDAFDFLVSANGSESLHETAQQNVSIPGIYNLKQMERILILRALRITHGNRADAAKILGIARSTLFEMLKRYKIIGPKANDFWQQRLQNEEVSG